MVRRSVQLSYKGDRRIPSNRPARLPPTWNRRLMEETREGGLDFTANVEDKRDHVRSPLDVPPVRSQTALPGPAHLIASFPMRLFDHSLKAVH